MFPISFLHKQYQNCEPKFHSKWHIDRSQTNYKWIDGSTFRKRAESYFLILNKGTSDFQPIFTESKERNRVGLNLRYEKKSRSYKQRLAELKKILPVAAKDFHLDSLRSIFVGRLISSGDLAINVTDQGKNSAMRTRYLIMKSSPNFSKNQNWRLTWMKY